MRQGTAVDVGNTSGALQHDPVADAFARARSLHHELLELSQRIDDTFLEVGVRLKEIRDEDLYRALDHPNFTAYVKGLEFSRSRAYALIGVVEDFYLSSRLDKDSLLALGWEKLALLRSAKDALTFESWAEKAARWGKRQLRQALGQAGFLPAPKSQLGAEEETEEQASVEGKESPPLYYLAAKKLTAVKLLSPEQVSAARASGVYPLIVAVVGSVYAKQGGTFGLPVTALPNELPLWDSPSEEA